MKIDDYYDPAKNEYIQTITYACPCCKNMIKFIIPEEAKGFDLKLRLKSYEKNNAYLRERVLELESILRLNGYRPLFPLKED